MAGVAVSHNRFAFQFGQIFGGEQLFDADVLGAGDMAEFKIFGFTQVNDDRIVTFVAVVQVVEQIGGFDVLGAATEVGLG